MYLSQVLTVPRMDNGVVATPRAAAVVHPQLGLLELVLTRVRGRAAPPTSRPGHLRLRVGLQSHAILLALRKRDRALVASDPRYVGRRVDHARGPVDRLRGVGADDRGGL